MKIILSLLLLLFTNISYSNTFKVIIPFTPGGGTDFIFKHLQQYVKDTHHINLVPIYKPGAEGTIGLVSLSETNDDESIIGLATISSIVAYKNKFPNSNFAYISLLGKTSMALVSSNKSGITNFNELESEIKTGSNKRNFGYGSPAQKLLLTQLFLLNNNKISNFIPYKGSSPLINDLIGGHIDVAFLPLLTVKNHSDSKKLMILANTLDDTTVNLNKRYPKWISTEGFVILLPNNVNNAVLTKWSQIIKSYIENKETVLFFKNNFIEETKFGKDEIEKSINNIQKFIKENQID